jgi:Cu2+-exporting ATPase
LSKALVAAVPKAHRSQGWTHIEELPGQGLSAQDVEGRTWRLGSAAWVGEPSLAGSEQGPWPQDAHEARVWLGCQGQALAAFAFDEVLRPGAQEALQALRADGVHLTLLTGDSAARAQALARRVGLDTVVAAATPQDKLDAVAAAQQAGQRVVMVGDGVNDAPVLARADASLAMGQGALVSRSHADAVITSNRLADLVGARRTAQRTLRIVRQNFIWAGLYNAVCIPLALIGWLPPWAAGLGMACSSLLVVLNALRAAR